MSHEILPWVLFNLFVLVMLAVDLGVFHRRSHTVHIREALTWSAVWIALSMLFALWLYVAKGPGVAQQFLAGYLIEKSLSVDNIFVFLLIFSYFRVPAQYQHKVLFWGILGALVMRAALIAVGVTLIERFHWVIYLFGAFLVYTGIKMVSNKDKELDPEHNPIYRFVRRTLRITPEFHGDHFAVMRNGKRAFTPLLLVLVFVETTDLVFALDSIPAVLAVSRDSFIVYTSNVFAILGLRALYFAVAGLMQMFHYLQYGLAAILVFVGVKMMSEQFIHIPIGVALGVIAVALALSVIASLLWPARKDPVPAPVDPVDYTPPTAPDGPSGEPKRR